jgi:hypothetical protein
MFEVKVGELRVNKQGLQYEVLDARLAKKIKIKFLLDSTELVTTKYYISQGLPLHPSHGKWKAGDVFQDKNGLDFELVEKVGVAKWKIRYTKDGAECEREVSSIKDKYGTHPIDNKVLVGNKYLTRNGYVTVVGIKNSDNIHVQFEDGAETIVQSSPLKKGSVGHPFSGLVFGKEYSTNSGWKYTISKYVSPYEVHVTMQDGSVEIVAAKAAKDGEFKPCNQPSVCDVGYIGQGRFTNLSKIKGEKAPEVVYSYWHRMIGRCFNPAEIIKNAGRRYIFVEVHKDWFNFQNFAEWALSQPNWNMGHDLDKDLLGSGIEYSVNSCTFLPSDINVFLAESWTRTTHNLPIGVQYLKPRTAMSKEGYIARCHTDKGREYLGYYEEPMEAYFAYKKAKEAYARVLAEKFREVITKDAYEKLMAFTLDKVYADEAPYTCASLNVK